MAYPVGPPRLAPIATTSRATASGPSPEGVEPKSRITNTRTNVAITSVTMFHSGLRISGPVANVPRIAPWSVSAW